MTASASNIHDSSDARVRDGLREQMALLDTLVADGAQPIGWKLGLGAPAALERLKLDAPVCGFLLDRSVLASGGSCSIGDWTSPTLEPEIAVKMSADLPAGAAPADVAAAVEGVTAAIELVDIDIPLDDLQQVLAGNIFHRRVVLGDHWAPLLPTDTVTLERDGTALGTAGAPFDALGGHPLDLLTHLANLLAGAGQALSAGDIVITGSMLPAIPVRPGERVRVTLGDASEASVQLVQ